MAKLGQPSGVAEEVDMLVVADEVAGPVAVAGQLSLAEYLSQRRSVRHPGEH